jgi:hypothetical protein
MNNNKLLIETYELCEKLIHNCVEVLKAYDEEQAKREEENKKFENDYLALYSCLEEEYDKNNALDEKLTRILNGETKNENRTCCVRTKRTRRV